MPKTRNINAVIDQALADPARRANIEPHRQEAVAEIIAHNLAELRRARAVTQVELAEYLHRTQPTISEFERSADPRLSTLREYVQALGGNLEICAVFGNDRIPLEV